MVGDCCFKRMIGVGRLRHSIFISWLLSFQWVALEGWNATWSSTLRGGRGRRLLSDDRIERFSVVAFGTSDTWGSGILEELTGENPAPYTYPCLLGASDVSNLAIRASGPGYPSVCLQSMMDRGQPSPQWYQVILLEFELRADEGLLLLAQRLRQRFPDAIMVFLDVWYPRMIRVQRPSFSDRESVTIQAYQRHYGFRGLHDPDFWQHLRTRTANANLTFQHRTDLVQLQNEIRHRVNGYVWRLPYPSTTNSSMIGPNLAHMAPLFSQDYKHLSKQGHEYVARGIRRLLRSIPNQYAPAATTRGEWQSHDACANWLLSGKCPHTLVSGLAMNVFDRTAHKHGLQVLPNNRVGEMDIVNPFSSPATLYLSYMSTGAPSKYPVVRISLVSEGTLSFELQPKVQRQPIHVAVTLRAFTLAPGTTSRLVIEPLEKTEWPFRIVATSIITSDQNTEDNLGLFNVEAAAELTG